MKKYVKYSRYAPIIEFLKKSNRIILKNIFNSNFKKRVLITYILDPFLSSKSITHSNQIEVVAIVENFHKLGYSIDVVDYRHKLNIKYENYDIIFGFGDVFEKSFYNKDFFGKRIYYATGAHPFYQIEAEIKRVKDFVRRTEVKALPQRTSNNVWPLSFSFSDALVVIGNSWTVNTYLPYYNGEIYNLNVTNTFDLKIDFNKKSSREIIWIGSKGSIHKGLDLALESHKELNRKMKMNVVGKIDVDLENYFRSEFKDVHFHGYLDINSEKFAKVIEGCSYVIFPSCSEGQSSALVLALGYGCIPIATEQSGVNVENYGKLIKNTMISDIVDAINDLEREYHDDSELIRKSIEISKDIREKHSIERFKQRFEYILNEIMI